MHGFGPVLLAVSTLVLFSTGMTILWDSRRSRLEARMYLTLIEELVRHIDHSLTAHRDEAQTGIENVAKLLNGKQ